MTTRRSFLAAIIGALAAVAAPALARLRSAPPDVEIGRYVGERRVRNLVESPRAEEVMDSVQYGEILHFGDDRSLDLPAYARQALDDCAELIAGVRLARPITKREYIWFPSGYTDKSDPLGLRVAVGGIKFFIDMPRTHHDAIVALEIKAGGWVRQEVGKTAMAPRAKGGVMREFSDFRQRGEVARYTRLVPYRGQA